MSGFPAPRRQRVPADRRTMGIAGAGLLGLLLLVGGFWWPGFFHRTTLDVHAAEKGVQTVLSDPNGYGATDVSNVKCNNGSNPVVKSGRSFGCEVEINGAQHHVTVTFADNSGTYWVGAPS